MKKILFILYSLLIIGCAEQKNNNKSDLFESGFDNQSQDSLINYYEQAIIDYYHETDTNEYKIELELTGKREYEDDSILILTFDEILKFGSWHYTNSSLCFLKKGNSLIPISSSSLDIKILDDDFYERDIQYPNRIHGIFKERIDLTHDGKPEYIFLSIGTIRTSLEEKYNIYQLNPNNKTFEISNLSISSNGFQGECDTFFGELGEYRIIEKESIYPVIEVKKIKTACNDSLFKVEELSSNLSYYKWNNKEKIFKEISYKNNTLDTSIFSINDYLDLEIVYEGYYGQLMMTTISQDSIEIYSDADFSISSNPFKIINTKLDSIKIEQSRLEYISISLPLSDGFDSAILDELIMQSNWIPYNIKDGTCIPFLKEDSRFDIKNKAELSESFITNMLSKSTEDLASEMLKDFVQTDRLAHWVNCTNIIRIEGIDSKGKLRTAYILDSELCN